MGFSSSLKELQDNSLDARRDRGTPREVTKADFLRKAHEFEEEQHALRARNDRVGLKLVGPGDSEFQPLMPGLQQRVLDGATITVVSKSGNEETIRMMLNWYERSIRNA